MKRTELKRKTPLVAKKKELKRTPLNVKRELSNAPLKSGKGLKPKTELKSYSILKAKTPLVAKSELKNSGNPRVKQKSARKGSSPYFSIFGSMDVCAITGSKTADGYKVIPHHIFEGPYKSAAEKYGFILPIRIDWHTGNSYSIHEDVELGLRYKRLCQDYYINELKKTAEEFVREFGHLY